MALCDSCRKQIGGKLNNHRDRTAHLLLSARLYARPDEDYRRMYQ